jgi:hypothetical protein
VFAAFFQKDLVYEPVYLWGRIMAVSAQTLIHVVCIVPPRSAPSFLPTEVKLGIWFVPGGRNAARAACEP